MSNIKPRQINPISQIAILEQFSKADPIRTSSRNHNDNSTSTINQLFPYSSTSPFTETH